MGWNWQQPEWPEFIYDAAVLAPLERRFLLHSGEFIGAFKHIGASDRDTLKIELIGDEALKTSAIEGEILDRESLQSSLRQQFGLHASGGTPVSCVSLSSWMLPLSLSALSMACRRNCYVVLGKKETKTKRVL